MLQYNIAVLQNNTAVLQNNMTVLQNNIVVSLFYHQYRYYSIIEESYLDCYPLSQLDVKLQTIIVCI